MKKEVRAVLKQYGFKYAENFGRQINAFVSANVSRLDVLTEYARGIHTSSLAACFPFVSNELKDPNGFYLGYNQYPVFVNFFTRNNERVNSNMMIIGKSGGGKSFATKTPSVHTILRITYIPPAKPTAAKTEHAITPIYKPRSLQIASDCERPRKPSYAG